MSSDFQAASTASHARVAANAAAAVAAAAGQNANPSHDHPAHAVSAAKTKSAPFARHMARINRLRNFVLALGIALVLLRDFVAGWGFAAYVAVVGVMVVAWAVAIAAPAEPEKAEG